jgi:hypothetical protein
MILSMLEAGEIGPRKGVGCEGFYPIRKADVRGSQAIGNGPARALKVIAVTKISLYPQITTGADARREE